MTKQCYQEREHLQVEVLDYMPCLKYKLTNAQLSKLN